jgi:nucleotide-binding universal stress UspA family protein
MKMNMVYEKILVAVDGSTEAEWAFKKAVNIAKRNNARLVLCHLVDVKQLTTLDVYDHTAIQRAETFAHDLLTQYHEEALAAGLKDIEFIMEHGSPKTRIAKEIAPEHDVDLIICGATGLNAVERFLIGSVSEHILRYSKCDVLVVRTQKEDEQPLELAKTELAE